MTIKELEDMVDEHKGELEDDAEANRKTYIVMTCKDGAGLASAAGSAAEQANMAVNWLQMIWDGGGRELVLDAIRGLLVREAVDELEDTEGVDKHEKMVN